MISEAVWQEAQGPQQKAHTASPATLPYGMIEEGGRALVKAKRSANFIFSVAGVLLTHFHYCTVSTHLAQGVA